LPIHGGVGNLMHPIICSAHGNALLYSKTIGISLAVRKGGTRCPQRVGKYPRLCRLTSICAIPRTLYCAFGDCFHHRLRRSRSAFVGMPLYRYFNSSFTSAKAFTANSESSRECAAETCVRLRAVPCGSNGTKTRTTSTPRSGSLLANVGTAPRSALTI